MEGRFHNPIKKKNVLAEPNTHACTSIILSSQLGKVRDVYLPPAWSGF